MSDEEDPAESAPEGSTCAEHPEHPAVLTCPRCGSYCCITCWQSAVKRCHPCLLRDPLPPVPWADEQKGLGARFVGTIVGAFSPTSTAPTFTRGEWTRGLSFLALTALPIAILSGIIPFTHHLRFGPTWFVGPIGDPSGPNIALDVAQAIGLGLLFGAVKLGLIAVPFLSLTRAFGVPVPSEPARQVMLYRGWLLLLAGRTGLLLGVVIWGMPAEPSSTMLLLAEVISLMPLMIMLWSMTSTARMMRIGPLASMIVVMIPFALLILVEPLVLTMLTPWLPSSEAIHEAVQSAQ